MDDTRIDPETVGEFADRLDAILAMETVPVPEPLKATGRAESMRALRDDMRRAVVAATGDDPWTS